MIKLFLFFTIIIAGFHCICEVFPLLSLQNNTWNSLVNTGIVFMNHGGLQLTSLLMITMDNAKAMDNPK